MNKHFFFPPFSAFEFFRRREIANAVFAQVKEMKTKPVFDFAFAKIVQIRLPVPVLNKIVGDVFG